MTVAVILAAGKGSRLGRARGGRPKPLVGLPSSATPLGLMANTLRKAAIDDVIVVRRNHQVQLPGCEIVDVHGAGNIIHSLMAARSTLERRREDVLVCYSDIVIEQRLLDETLATGRPPAQLVVPVDVGWESYYRWRFAGTVGDAESLRIIDRRIVEIGAKVQPGDALPEAQYIGLVWMSWPGFQRACAAYDAAEDPHIDMTALLRRMINSGQEIYAVEVDGGWLEIDSAEDLGKVTTVLSGGTEVQFFDPEGISWTT